MKRLLLWLWCVPLLEMEGVRNPKKKKKFEEERWERERRGTIGRKKLLEIVMLKGTLLWRGV